MARIKFITGPVGSGKTVFIEKNFSSSPGNFVFDLAKISQQLFGHFQALEEMDGIVQIYNHASEEGLLTLLDGKTLVVEYCTNKGYDDDFAALVKYAQKTGICVEVIHIELDEMLAGERIAQADPQRYFSSAKLREETLEVLEGVIDSFEANQNFELILELGGENGSTVFYRSGEEGEERYFYLTPEIKTFDFEPDFEVDKLSEVNYLKTFPTFEKALNTLISEVGLFQLVPLKVNKEYKKAFQQAVKRNMDKPPLPEWKAILN
ncbi:hypothetical protein KI659_15345 [Litoribacter alkaliphilus]|uniref:Uncharacterized protein n=1 Tax=Litoribacter ruber TaxID=702568 RepID=A0AAP2G1Z4_9BACT|nr:hypothetical protein [Litoribacter alkaliphilus]MBS9525394.1 hypothetical protein [Litoribacter alkaliphilus]